RVTRMIGGGGFDTLDDSADTTSVTVKLLTNVATGTVRGVGMIENVVGDTNNDSLTGDTSSNVLFGGPGNDTILRGGGRDLLIGGTGVDKITGGAAADLIIGGSTTFDLNDTALQAIMAEWGRTDLDFATRRQHLSGTPAGGKNGSYVLNSTTVLDDKV